MTGATDVPTLQLSTGSGSIPIPVIGYGVWEVPDEVATDGVLTALETGYRHVDTAALYMNERGVGRALQQTDVPREEIFLTTKVWNNYHADDRALVSMKESLERLQQDYVDLFLIHWPAPGQDKYVDAWKTMLKIRDEGMAKAVGVCNFNIEHLERVAQETGEMPPINQIEVQPYLTQEKLRAFNAEHDIITEDWSPLGAALGIVDDPVIQRIAQETGRDAGQVILRWHVQLGSVVLTRSVKPERIKSNFDLMSFTLSDEQMSAISGLNKDQRTGPNPDEFNKDAE